MFRRSLLSGRPGWSFVEVIFLAAIAGFVVAALAAATKLWLSQYDGSDSKVEHARVSAANVAKAIQYYQIKFGVAPKSLQDLVIPPDSGGRGFISPEGVLDPWGQPFQFDATGPRNQGSQPDVWTTHPDTGKPIVNFR